MPDDVAGPARDGLANAVAAAGDRGDTSVAIVNAAQQAFIDGWQHAMWAGAAAMTALLLVIGIRTNNPVRPELDTSCIEQA